MPNELYEIISDEEKRKKLVIYINPPYAEATASNTINSEKNRHKAGVSANMTYSKYLSKLGRGINEVFAQFLARMYFELPNVYIGHFATLKLLVSQNFTDFRSNFLAKLENMFLVPAKTFDNVKGEFPIGFFIWNTQQKEVFTEIVADAYNHDNSFLCRKTIFPVKKNGVILNWMANYYDKTGERLAYMVRGASDFQNNQIVFITLNPSKAVLDYSRTHDITANNLIQSCIFFTARHIFEHTWLNNQDQFLYPNDNWVNDKEFQLDCLVYTLFHGKNNVQSEYGINHWIPFTEAEVGSKKAFASDFMAKFLRDFMVGKIDINPNLTPHPPLLEGERAAGVHPSLARRAAGKMSREAAAVFEAGKELWSYYFTKRNININASFYDIRHYFQGEKNGRMNSKSENDEHYNELLKTLRDNQKNLAAKIAEKVYAYGFLRQ